MYREPWSFIVIDGPGGLRLLIAMEDQTAEAQRISLAVLDTLRFAGASVSPGPS